MWSNLTDELLSEQRCEQFVAYGAYNEHMSIRNWTDESQSNEEHNNEIKLLTPNSEILDKHVRSMEGPTHTLQAVKVLLLSFWCQITQHPITGLVQSMPQQVRADLAAEDQAMH